MRVELHPWSEDDLPLLRAANTPEMTEHLGGPETEDQIVARHRKYVELAGTGTGRMFTIELVSTHQAAGNIGFWARPWQGETVYEIGWNVLPGFQGTGVGTSATQAAVAAARAERKHRYIHAFPSVDNPGSNAICRKVGFVLLGEVDFEYPPGRPMRCNDWRLELNGTR